MQVELKTAGKSNPSANVQFASHSNFCIPGVHSLVQAPFGVGRDGHWGILAIMRIPVRGIRTMSHRRSVYHVNRCVRLGQKYPWPMCQCHWGSPAKATPCLAKANVFESNKVATEMTQVDIRGILIFHNHD